MNGSQIIAEKWTESGIEYMMLYLYDEQGALLRMNRSIQVEGVFGVLKEDYGFRRFLTRGKKNVETQFFLLAFALNIEKLCNREKKGRIGLDLFQLNAS